MNEYNIYRGQDGVIDYENVVATMDLDDTQVIIPAQDLPPNTIWHFVRRRVAACGLESPDSPPCVIQIDADGDMFLASPNPPSDLRLFLQVDGKFLLRWRYGSFREAVKPTGFHIYIDSDAGFNFTVPDATVEFKAGIGKEFQWLSDAYAQDQRVKFIVRSFNIDAGESQNTNYVAGYADSEGPDAITGLMAETEEL